MERQRRIPALKYILNHQEAAFTKYKSHTLFIDHEQNSGAVKMLPSVETKVHPRSSADLRDHLSDLSFKCLEG